VAGAFVVVAVVAEGSDGEQARTNIEAITTIIMLKHTDFNTNLFCML
jgi:hypothetical protein